MSARSSEQQVTLSAIAERVRRLAEENERLLRSLAGGETRFRQLAKAVWQVQEEQRRGIALELHDGVGQILTALVNRLRHDGAGSTQSPDDTLELAESALAEIRRLSRALRPSVLDDLGLEAALRWLVRTSGDASGLDIALSWSADVPSLDAQTETLIFRIVQEALTNSIKHADAGRARVSVASAHGRLNVVISDDGRGFDTRQVLAADSTGFGVRGMRDRAELFGGSIDIDSGPESGTVVRLTISESGG